MFHDRARIHVQAGRGGDGSLHFRREKHVPKGGPDGGDGGRGGDIVLVADPNLRDLSSIRPNQRLKAGHGEPGRGQLKHGANGADVELHVPVGTQVFDEDGQLMADLASPHARVVAADLGARSGPELRPALANDDHPSLHLLAVEELHAEPLRLGVAPVAGRPHAFLVRHYSVSVFVAAGFRAGAFFSASAFGFSSCFGFAVARFAPIDSISIALSAARKPVWRR